MTLPEFITALNTKFADTDYTFSTDKPGAKFTRVVQSAPGHRSVFCFVDAAGNGYKSRGWKSPETKHIRFTLATVDISRVDPYGSWLYIR